MRITFLLPYAGLAGGVRVVVCIAEHLRRRGHSVTIVSIPRPAPSIRQMLRNLAARRLPWRPTLASASDREYFAQTKVIHRVVDRARAIADGDLPDADWVVATAFMTAHWAARLSAQKGRKAHFIQQYEVNFWPGSQRQVDESWRLPFKKIACARWLSELGESRFDLKPMPIVPNGIDPNLFDARMRRRGNPPTLGFLYSPQPVKGLHVVRPVVDLVRRAIPDLKLIAFGTYRPRPEFPLPENCEFHYKPPQSELKDLYGRCDVWLCASESEGFHLPTHEAMACRCAVVSTRVGGPMDMITHGIDGFLAPPGNAGRLAKHVLEILAADEERWTSLTRRGYDRARQYSWEASAELFEQALAVPGP